MNRVEDPERAGWRRLLVARKCFCCNGTKKKELVHSANTAHRGIFVILISPHYCFNSGEAQDFMYDGYMFSIRIYRA